jgi:hypothetical protein
MAILPTTPSASEGDTTQRPQAEQAPSMCSVQPRAVSSSTRAKDNCSHAMYAWAQAIWRLMPRT